MIDREIRDALDVDPSPDFLARVRTRIAHEPERSAWHWSWAMTGAVALAAAIVTALVLARPAPQPRLVLALRPAEPVAEAGPKGPTLQEMGRRPGPVGPAEPATARTAGPKGPARHRTKAPVVSGFSRTVAIAPEILVDPREARALRQLIAGVRDGRVDLAAVQNSVTPAVMELEPVTDIVIAPITIEPLAPLSGAQGVRP